MLVVVAVAFPHWRVLRFRTTFTCHRHSTLASQDREALHQLWFYPDYFRLLYFCQAFPSQFYHERYGFESAFLTHRRFLLCAPSPTFLAHFVTQMRAGTPHPGSSSMPALTKLSLPADASTWTTHIVVTGPLISQLRQWATKYRVKIELLNMFCLFKAYVKTIKKHFEQDLYYLKLLRWTSKLFWKSSHPKKQPSII